MGNCLKRLTSDDISLLRGGTESTRESSADPLGHPLYSEIIQPVFYPSPSVSRPASHVTKEEQATARNLSILPGRKRLQAIEESDSENERQMHESKKPKFEISTEEKERRFLSASQIIPNADPIDALLSFNWDVSRSIRHLKEKGIVTVSKSAAKPKSNPRQNSTEENGKIQKSFDGNCDLSQNWNGSSNLPVYDSDEDSDYDLLDEVRHQRTSVLKFINAASQTELLTVRSCSEKKVNAILELRPFSNWNDLIDKFESSKFLTPDVLNSCQELLVKRNNVASIMSKCKKMVENLEAAIEKGGGITEPPSSLSKSLKLADYQMIGLNWLVIMFKEKMNGILADEMGLGKTVQVIAFLTYLKEQKLAKGCHLIVVPSSTLDNWESEINKWSPSLVVEKYYGNQSDRRLLRTKYAKQGFKDIDILLTTYHTMGSTPEEKKMFRVSKLHCAVFDEAHMLKNMTTQRYCQLSKINTEMRILLTGTPLQNNLLELMSLLCFVMPSIFAKNTEDIKSLFQKKKSNVSTFEQTQIEHAKRIMKPFVLRRLKKQVLQCLPKKTESVLKVPMPPSQKEHYKSLVEYYKNYKDNVRSTSECAGITIMMDMRKLANHPALMRYYYTDADLHILADKLSRCSSYKSDNTKYIFEDLAYLSDFQVSEIIEKHKISGMDLPDKVILNSAKLEELDKLLPKLKKEGHRVLVFSQFTMMLDILERYLAIRNHKYIRMDGSTVVTERQGLIDAYNDDSSIFIFLLSTKAGGMGVNLTAADVAIIHDIDFNPYNDKQAEDRCHRMGQTKPVHIYRLVTEGTIEEGMLMVAEEKLKLEMEITTESEDVEEHKCVVRLLTLALEMDDKSVESLFSIPNAATGT